MRYRSLASTSAVVAFLVGSAGCGQPVGQLKGHVTSRGMPVAGAELIIESQKYPDQQFYGLADDTGAYHVSYRTYSGLPTGSYQITIARHLLPDGRPLPAGEEGAALKAEGRAVKQVVRFEKEIVAGTNAIDFELSEGKKIEPQ